MTTLLCMDRRGQGHLLQSGHAASRVPQHWGPCRLRPRSPLRLLQVSFFQCAL